MTHDPGDQVRVSLARQAEDIRGAQEQPGELDVYFRALFARPGTISRHSSTATESAGASS
jgi:hypothetical protein